MRIKAHLFHKADRYFQSRTWFSGVTCVSNFHIPYLKAYAGNPVQVVNTSGEWNTFKRTKYITFTFPSLLNTGLLFKNQHPYKQIASLKTTLYLGIHLLSKVTNKKSHKLFPFVKMVNRYVNVYIHMKNMLKFLVSNMIYIVQDIPSISALIPCARGFVSPAIPC